MIRKVFRVTSADVEKTKNGFEVFSLELDGKIRATQLVPLKESDRTSDKLYQICKLIDFGLESLVGKYISLLLKETQFGFQFSKVTSCDVVQDFTRLLDKADGKPFETSLDVYSILSLKGYPISLDGSISLRGLYSGLDIKKIGEQVVCYPNNLDDTHLTLENIQAIYNHFYKDKNIDTGNDDRASEYFLSWIAICESRTFYQKHRSGGLLHDRINVIQLGDKLLQKHLDYLSSEKQLHGYVEQKG